MTMTNRSSMSKHIPPYVSSRIDGTKGEDSDENEYNDDKDQAYLTFAQKLNNSSAMCIEMGYYEKATQLLQKALVICQKQSDESLSKACTSDDCIDFSDDFASENGASDTSATAALKKWYENYQNDESSDDEVQYARKRNISEEELTSLTKSISNPKIQKVSAGERNRSRGDGKNASWSIKDEYCEEELTQYENQDDGIYKRPIRVKREGDSMGALLFLVITFNLALTHQLEVAATCNHKHYNPNSAKKALLFYELASAHETRLLLDSKSYWDSLSSVRFNKILNNNLKLIVQFLPATSLEAANGLLSSVSHITEVETQRLCGKSSKGKSSKNKGLSRDKSGGKMSRSPPKRTKSSSQSISKLQNALGDMTPGQQRRGRRSSCIG